MFKTILVWEISGFGFLTLFEHMCIDVSYWRAKTDKLQHDDCSIKRNKMENTLVYKNPSIAIIGLGYVGLPLAIEFSNKYPTVGYDKNEKRISSNIRGGMPI